MLDLLVSVILATCPGSDRDHKGQVITNECQEWFTNCAVTSNGDVTAKSIQQCVDKYEKQHKSGTSNQ